MERRNTLSICLAIGTALPDGHKPKAAPSPRSHASASHGRNTLRASKRKDSAGFLKEKRAESFAMLHWDLAAHPLHRFSDEGAPADIRLRRDLPGVRPGLGWYLWYSVNHCVIDRMKPGKPSPPLSPAALPLPFRLAAVAAHQCHRTHNRLWRTVIPLNAISEQLYPTPSDGFQAAIHTT